MTSIHTWKADEDNLCTIVLYNLGLKLSWPLSKFSLAVVQIWFGRCPNLGGWPLSKFGFKIDFLDRDNKKGVR